MREIDKAHLNTSDQILEKYQKLIRIHANAEGLLDRLRNSRHLHLCKHAPEDLEMIQAFITEYKKHFLKRGKDYQGRFENGAEVQARRRPTLRSSNRSIQALEPRTMLKATKPIQTRSSKESTEIIDLTMDSDEEVIEVGGDVKLQEALKQPDSPIRVVIDLDVWYEYEVRRQTILWYQPEKDFDEDMCP